jgi:hypothetical protein
MKQEEVRNSAHPQDFGAHEQPLANGKSARVERRTSVNRSPCGRRTSLIGSTAQGAPPCRQYTRRGTWIPEHCPMNDRDDRIFMWCLIFALPAGLSTTLLSSRGIRLEPPRLTCAFWARLNRSGQNLSSASKRRLPDRLRLGAFSRTLPHTRPAQLATA